VDSTECLVNKSEFTDDFLSIRGEVGNAFGLQHVLGRCMQQSEFSDGIRHGTVSLYKAKLWWLDNAPIDLFDCAKRSDCHSCKADNPKGPCKHLARTYLECMFLTSVCPATPIT
jgi:hypothetical protein